MLIDSLDVLLSMWAVGHFSVKLRCTEADKYSCWAFTIANAFNCYCPIWLDVPTLVSDFDFFFQFWPLFYIKELKNRHHSFTFYSLRSVHNLFSLLIACCNALGLSFFKQLICNKVAVQPCCKSSGGSSHLKGLKTKFSRKQCLYLITHGSAGKALDSTARVKF